MKRTYIGYATLVLVACGISSTRADERPNIVLIVADDLGWADLGFQGSKDIKSPNLDRLAAGGIRFTDGHVTASVCSPSRAGLMTGRYQQRFGHEANSPPGDQGMDLKQATLATALKKQGYRTGVIGKWHLGMGDEYYPTKRGFDYFYGFRGGARGYFPSDREAGPKRLEENGRPVAFTGYLTDVLGDKAVEFIDESGEKPFFLFLSFNAPHTPMHATDEDKARFKHISNPKRRTYAAMIWAMDRAIGKVLARLDRDKQTENTLIWFLSDNGGATTNGSSNLPLAGHKGIKFEGGIRVPFIMQWKKRFGEPSRYDPMISSLDIFPTSLKAAGANIDEELKLDGVDLLPHLEGTKKEPPHQHLYWHKLWFSAVRDGPWKLIHVQDYGQALYRLDEDPNEKANLAKQHPDRVKTMKKDLDRWKATLNKPRWTEGKTWFRVHSRNHVRIIEGGR